MSAVEWVNQAVGHPVGDELNRLEAEMVTAKIKSYVGVAWVLLYEAHARKAHKAMGYETWADYVEAEFDMSRSHSYRLISQARMVMEISEAVSPKGDIDDEVSTLVDIDERTARDLADHVEEAKAAAVEAADALGEAASAADRAEAAKAAVEKVRYDAVERARQRRAEQAAAELAEHQAAALEGQNADGEVLAGEPLPTSGGEGREAEGGADDEPASGTEDAGGGCEPPAPSSPPAPLANPDDSYRTRMSKEFAGVRNGLIQLDPARMLEVSDLERRGDIESLCVDLRDWIERVESVLVHRPRMEAVK